jgi:hypothetical protein
MNTIGNLLKKLEKRRTTKKAGRDKKNGSNFNFNTHKNTQNPFEVNRTIAKVKSGTTILYCKNKLHK